jgi:hypothetical protein
MAIDLLKRSEKGSGLTNAEEDANKTAIETFINAILAGTAGYAAGDANKVGGVAAAQIIGLAALGSAGWYKLANGLIVQWGPSGSFNNTGGLAGWTYPIAFPAACVYASCTIFYTSGDGGNSLNLAPSTTYAQFRKWDGVPTAVTGYCIAIGY